MSLQLAAQAEERASAAVNTYFERLADRHAHRLGEAQDKLAAEHEALAGYERDGTVPITAAQRVWIRASDDATGACSQVIHGLAEQSLFDEARAVREAVRRWLYSIGALPDSEAHPAVPRSAADEELGRRRVEEDLRTRVADAHIEVAERRTELAKIRAAAASFAEDRTVPADRVDDLWLHIADIVSQAAADYLEDRGDATAVEDAKAVRGMVQHWLQEQGHHIDTSATFMADLPRCASCNRSVA